MGVAVVAADATAIVDRIPLPTDATSAPTPPANIKPSEPIVETVKRNQVTVMNGQVSIKVRDAGLASLIAEKLHGVN